MLGPQTSRVARGRGRRGRRPNWSATETDSIVGAVHRRAQQVAFLGVLVAATAHPAHSSISTRTSPSFSSSENPVASPCRRKTTAIDEPPTLRLCSSTVFSHGGRNGAPAAHAWGAHATG